MNSVKFSRSGAVALTIWMVGVIALWYIAFSPVSETTPEWLSVVRNICFGKRRDGLPEGYGWITLFFSPMAMMVAIFLIWSPAVLYQSVISAFRQRSAWIIVFTILTILFVYEIFWALKKMYSLNLEKNISYDSNDNNDSVWKTSQIQLKIPDLSFKILNKNGIEENFTASRFKGPAILTFAYGHCETVCPVIIKNSIRGIEKYNRSLEKNKESNLSAQLYVITLDPWRDTPSLVESITDSWELPDFAHFITSREYDKINNLLDYLEVPRSRDEKTGEIAHPALVYVLDVHSRIIFKFNNPDSRIIQEALRKGNLP